RDWNDTKTVWPQALDRGLHGLIEDQATRTPDSIAVSSEEGSLTYAELNRQADELAQTLREMGVGPETLVGIKTERSCELLFGLLAILKAGGAYVPIDPSYPEERQKYLLEDSGVEVVYVETPQSVGKVLPGPQPPGRLYEGHAGSNRHGHPEDPASDRWGQDRTGADHRTVGDAPTAVDPGGSCQRTGASLRTVGVSFDSLAYVIYTSGSTGRPKGAMNTHGAVLNRLLWMQEAFGL